MLLQRTVTGIEAGGATIPAPRTWVPAPRIRRLVRSEPTWSRRYRAVLVAVDVLTAAAVAAAVLSAITAPAAAAAVPEASLALVLVWPVLLAVSGAYSPTVVGTGSDEFRLVGRAGLLLLAGAGLLSSATPLLLPAPFVAVGLPGLTAATALARYGVRQQLVRLRVRGHCTKRVVVVGRGGAVLELVARLRRERHAGLEVVAACVTPQDAVRVAQEAGIPVGALDDVVTLAAAHSADTVAVTSASETASAYLRRLSWQLEGTGLELLVSPGLIEVAGPRLHIRPFEGLPLLSVEQPRFEGWQRVVKGGLDRAVAAVAVLLLAPVLLGIAIAVRLDSGGPVLFRQERVGVGGRSFTMLKFRSMVVDADKRLDAVRDANISDGLLFKLRDDPRVTRVGRWLRRLSLDELPQLVNVMTGSMSLVGPRPPLPTEVARYDDDVRRRLLVKPGLTGLWQISGRSDLSWEESVRLDLRYVENWSLATDLLILWRTARAVLTSSGAY